MHVNENFVLVVTSSCCIRWNSTGYQGRSPWLVGPQPDDENVTLLAPGFHKKLSLLAQIPLTCRSICSGVREAVTELAIAATSPQTDSGSELLPSDPLKGLRDLAARRPLAKSVAGS